VETFDRTLRILVADMFETMYASEGVGLAATQVNVALRVLVADCSEDRSGALALINPCILSTEGCERHEEGCLSVPGVREEVERAQCIRAEAQDENGQPFQFEAEGLLAVCLQHEIDHLNGKLFIDYLSSLKRNRIKKRLTQRACAGTAA
jgi:peptide deformylase